MLRNLTRQLRAFIESLIQRSSAYLENERTHEISQQENNETAMFLFLLVIVWLVGLQFRQAYTCRCVAMAPLAQQRHESKARVGQTIKSLAT